MSDPGNQPAEPEVKPPNSRSCRRETLSIAAILLGGTGFITLFGPLQLHDGAPPRPPSIVHFAERRESPPVKVELPFGELIVERVIVNSRGDEIRISCRAHLRGTPETTALILPHRYASATPPRLVDDRGRSGEFHRGADALPRLVPWDNLRYSAASTKPGHMEFRFECRFTAPGPNPSELVFTMPCEYFLVRDRRSDPFVSCGGQEVEFRLPGTMDRFVSRLRMVVLAGREH